MPPDSSPPPISGETQIDMKRLRAYRLGRVREQLRRRDYAGALLFDPINIRYATDSRNMAVWTLHNAARYCFVATEGPVVLFDYRNCEFMSDELETIDEVRPATSWFYFSTGPRLAEKAALWAAEVAELVTAHGGGNRRLALDHCDPLGAAALAGHMSRCATARRCWSRPATSSRRRSSPAWRRPSRPARPAWRACARRSSRA